MLPHDLPTYRIREREPFLALERCSIEVTDSGLVANTVRGAVEIPVGSIKLLFLEPGCSITHAAIRLCNDVGTSIMWTGEGGVKIYGTVPCNRTRAKNTQHQCELYAHHREHIAKRMLNLRYPGAGDKLQSLDEMRGAEGYRVKAHYKIIADQCGIHWHGRNYDPDDMDHGDLANRSLSITNNYLYNLAEATILGLGYTPALGFLHATGTRPFAYDIADILKFEHSVPLAFQYARQNRVQEIQNDLRKICRDHYREHRVLKRCIDVTKEVMAPA